MAEPAPIRRAGTLDEALTNGRSLLAGHPRMALTQAQAILEQDRTNGDALRLAAAAHRALGEAELALNAEIAAITVSQHLPEVIAAARALQQGEYGEASRLAAAHLRNAPEDLAALTVSAESAIALALPDKAEPLLRKVLQRAPTFVPARRLLLNALIMLDRLREARAMLLEMIAANVDDERAQYRILVRIDGDLGDHQAAAATCAKLVRMAGATADDWLAYADSLRFAGQKGDAIEAYRRAIETDPGAWRAWWGLADIDAGAIGDEDVATLERALGEQKNDPEAAGNLEFALGIAYDARRRPERAFPHFAAGNALRRAAQPYDAHELTGQVDRNLASFAAAAPSPPDSNGGPVPIFVIGMPRSGSTLVERILGRHSLIEGVGELSIVPHMIQRLKLDHPGEGFERQVAALPATELARLGAWYLARAGEHRRSAKPWFVDKLHMNWQHLPLILRMLPQARIVDVRRGALDCCWSNYKTLFARGHPAASDLSDLGRFYRDYVRQTDALRSRTGRIHLLDYEALVDDIAGEAGALFEALGLALEPQCLDFHLSSEPVATASSEQVRQPLNRRGIGAWRAYEPWLSPLKEALGPLAKG
ncbi:MAG: sulfotransferase [Candidatus Andeanibacterium colombiense]|uniref:Sulfotransferase n=1 Tax=Candidatus Andeanibacterium colombiense TaxID=3121345 RepID=A0AAJ6BPL1_9SPHN|nr:MAG: sulfotransferase [Sphingomonadaceae bacterium]